MKKNNRVVCGILQFLVYLLWAASFLLYAIALWIRDSLDVTFLQIINTLAEGTEGANLRSLIFGPQGLRCLAFFGGSLLFIAVYAAVKHALRLRTEKKSDAAALHRYRFAAGLGNFVLVAVAAGTAALAFITAGLNEENLRLLYLRTTNTKLYEREYVRPDASIIGRDGETKNLLYIYLESMESTYTSTACGGYLPDVDLIPNLAKLAAENVSFSPAGVVGGLRVTNNADYTKGALYAMTTGLPVSIVKKPDLSFTAADWVDFKPGVVSLGDVLEEAGYAQEFLCGSDGEYAGRKQYFEQHGNYKVFDYFRAVEAGYIDRDYKVFWGFEDRRLYGIAKEELTSLSQQGRPFNFTMLTVDTHYPDGWVCELCREEYDEQYYNVIACADRQLADFLTWCGEQPWYEDTVIVIVGDHLTMKRTMFSSAAPEQRRVYNCIINSAVSAPENEKHRTATTFDMFPTTLAAMGFRIDGDRLGLGTNLFSEEQTLAERIGFDKLNNELLQKSQFYEAYLN